ncbi:conserved hypothetical protein [Pediculus humanus corporis]|uniref:Peptidase S1 domain-containing protein n=1 Tax=Pediculus humanus subsp. corporis TaxID=121224 RepID=E0VZQ1_PEDHC|nr:uncharacterized protein Phum_PHUM537190 [Pediculus humanus corporis]EEB18857.1 conserved hypothetical protein [Pediculus humanus corporis]
MKKIIYKNLDIPDPLRFNYYNNSFLRKYYDTGLPDGVYSSLVLLVSRPSQEKCTGTLIKSNLILTAALCVHYHNRIVDEMTIVKGKISFTTYYKHKVKPSMNFEELINIEERRTHLIYVHPDWYEWSVNIAFIKVEKPFHIGKLFSISTKKKERLKDCVSVGFGHSENFKKQITLQYIESGQFALRKIYDVGHFCQLKKTTLDSQTCLAGIGSPLICNDEIWGVCALIATTKPELTNADCKPYDKYCYYPLYHVEKWFNLFAQTNASHKTVIRDTLSKGKNIKNQRTKRGDGGRRI